MPLWNFFGRRSDPPPPQSDTLHEPHTIFVPGRRFNRFRDPVDLGSERENNFVSPTDSSQCGVITDELGDTNSDPLPLSHLPSAPDATPAGGQSTSSIHPPGNINGNSLSNQVRPPSPITFVRENPALNFIPTPDPRPPQSPRPRSPAHTFFFGPRALNPAAAFRFPSAPPPPIRPSAPNRPPGPPPTPPANMAASNFFIPGIPAQPHPAPAPLVNINLEMPKYGHQLSKLGLRLFIQRFQRWAEAKRLTIPQAKLTLPLAFSNATAQHYFMINFAEQDNPAIDWPTFINNFLTKCPMEVDDHTSILDLLKTPKPDLEKASVYLQRLRAAMSEEYTRHAEPDIIRLLMDNLDPSLRQFLECKGPPLTYGDLVSLVKHYEDRGLQKTLAPQSQPPLPLFSPPVPPPTGLDGFAGLFPPPVAQVLPPTAPSKSANNAPDSGLTLGVNLANVTNIQGLLDHVKHLQAAILKLNVSPQQTTASTSSQGQSDNRTPRPNGQRPPIECYYCGHRGHKISDCRKKMRDDSFQVSGRGRGRGGGNRNGDFTRNPDFSHDNRRREDSPRDRRRNDNFDYRRRDDSPRNPRHNPDFSRAQRHRDDSPRRRDDRNDDNRNHNRQRDEGSPPGSPSISGNGRLWTD